MEIKDVLTKIGYVRNKANLSAREVSLRMGMSPQYVAKIESGNIVLTVEKLLDILKICNFPVSNFFYDKNDKIEIEKEITEIIQSLPLEKKKNIIELLKS